MFGTNTFAQVSFAAASGLLYPIAVLDTATAADSIFSRATFVSVIAESVQAADLTASQFSVLSSLSDGATAADAPTANVVFPVSVADTATAEAAAPAAATTFLASVADTATVLAEPRCNVGFSAVVLESLLALDILLGRELWEQIDDTQLTDWTDILVPTTIEDISVFGGANFGVTAFAGNSIQSYDPNPVFWTEIDNAQDTVWTDIVAV